MTQKPKTAAEGHRFRLPLTPTVVCILILGVIVHLAGYLGIASFSSPMDPVPEVEGFVSFPQPVDDQVSPLLAEQALLFDSAPLFLPTAFNYVGQQELRDVTDPTLGPLFADFQPELRLGKLTYDATALFKERVRYEDKDDFLELPNWEFFRDFTRGASEVQPVYPRDGFIRVVRLPSGEEIRSFAVQAGDLAGLADITGNWSPFSFQVLVGGTGILGAPLLAGNSGFPEVHDLWRTWLGSSAFLATLESGYYRIEIGP